MFTAPCKYVSVIIVFVLLVCQDSLEKLTLDEMKTQFDENATDLEFVDQHPLPATNFRNRLLPNTSHKVMMKVEKTSRHLVAAQNIKPGKHLNNFLLSYIPNYLYLDSLPFLESSVRFQ